MSVSNSTCGSGGPLPVGCVLPYIGQLSPRGFLLCDGSTYRIADYPVLSLVLGGIYGSTGTTFTVPDLRAQFPLAAGLNTSSGAGVQSYNTNTTTAGANGAVECYTTGLTTDQMPYFTTNTQSGIEFTVSLNNPAITTNSGTLQPGSGDFNDQTMLLQANPVFQTESTVMLSGETVSYTSPYSGSAANQYLQASAAIAPGFEVSYYIRRDYHY